MSDKIDDSKDVFKLVKSIADYTQVYARLGCGHIINSGKLKRHWPCPKTDNSGSSKSTKFRLHKDFAINGRCIHNDVNNGQYMGIIEYTMWMYNLGEIDAAMEVLDAAGIQYEDLRRGSNRPRLNEGASPVPTLTPELIAERKQKEFAKGKRAVESIAKTWSAGVPLTNPNALALLDKYMQERGLPPGHADKMPKHLRVNFNLLYPGYYRESEKAAWYAGVMVPMCDATGKRCNFHRHYFQKKTGKKVPEDNRKLMMEAPWSLEPGSFLEYDEPYVFDGETGEKSAIIQVGEGMETMEGVRAGTNLPVQPMFSDYFLKNYQPPEIEGVKPENYFIEIYEDKDVSGAGTRACNALAQRLTKLGYRCRKHVPPMDIPEGAKGVDWLDVWNKLGVMAFHEELRDPDLEQAYLDKEEALKAEANIQMT